MIRSLKATVAALLLLVLWTASAHATASGAIVCTGVSTNFQNVTCPDINEELVNANNRGIIRLTSVAGTNDYTANAAPYALTSYQDGQFFTLKVPNNNTTAARLNANALGLKAIVKQNGDALASGDLQSTVIYLLQYYGSDDHFRVMGSVGTPGADDDIPEIGDLGVIDTSSELRGLITDEVGTGALMFGLAPSMSDDLSCTGSQVVRRNAGDTAFECATGGGGLASTDIDTSAEIRTIMTDEVGTGVLVFLGTPADDQVPVGDSASATTWRTLPDSDGATQKLQYDQATNTFSAGTDDDVPEVGDFAALVGGSGIDNNSGTLDIDLTELSTATFGAGAFTALTFDAGAVDPALTVSSGQILVTAGGTAPIFGVDDQGAFRLFEEDAGGSNYIEFVAPAAIGANRQCILVDGAAPIPDSCVGNGTDDTGAGGGDAIQVEDSDNGGTFTAATDADFEDSGDIDFVLNTGTTPDQISALVRPNSVALTTDTTGNYVLDVADGTGIDGTASGEGATYTPTLDLTEISSATFGAGSFTTLTFDAGATDPVWTYGSDTVALTAAATFKHGSTTSVAQDDYASTALTPATQISGTTAAGGSVGIATFANSATTPASLNLGHAAGASVGTFTAVTSGDDLAVINFTGADGTNNEPAASILVEADAATGANDMPGRITFATTADAAATPTARLTLDSAGILFPATNDGVPLGKSGNAFADLWLASGGLIEFDGGTTNTLTCTGGNCTIEGNGLYRVGGTDVAVADGGTGASSLTDLITLTTHTTGSYVQQVADGTGIDGTANAEGATYTPTLDLTEISSATWGAGAFTTLTYDAGATDPVETFGSGTYQLEAVASFRQADAANAGGSIKLLEDPGTGSNFLALLAPASITSDATCTLENDANFIPDSCVGDGTDDDVPEVGDFAALVGGSGIDNNSGTLDLDLTEISSATFGAGSFTTLTFDAGATDPLLTFGSGTILAEGVISIRRADAANAGGELRLLEDPGTGSNFITFVAPASITADRTCTLVDGGAPIPDSCVGDGTDAGAGGGIANVVEDTTPQLGGALDTNGFAIEFGTANTDTSVVRASAGDISVEGNIIYRAGGTDVALADGGTGASLSDPGGNRILAWDDTANAVEFQDAGTGLTAGTSTLDCDTPSETAVGCIELATTAEAETGTDTSRAVTAAGVLAAVTGKKPIWIPAGALIPRTTAGCVIADTELATNKVMLRYCGYNQTTEQGAQFNIRMPDSWDEGTVTMVFVWSHPSTTTNFGVAWAGSCVAVSDNEAQDAAMGTRVIVTDTGGTTDNKYTTSATGAITCAGSPAAGDNVTYEFERVTGDAGDTMAVDARLQGVTVYYTDNAFVEP